MKDIRNLTSKEAEKIFRLMKPIGYEDGDELHYGKIYTTDKGEQIIEELPMPPKEEVNG